jgi:hypothetical protein
VPDTPTSEQIRLEAEKLRDTAVKLIEYAATLIAMATELEKQVARLKPDSPNKANSHDHRVQGGSSRAALFQA